MGKKGNVIIINDWKYRVVGYKVPYHGEMIITNDGEVVVMPPGDDDRECLVVQKVREVMYDKDMHEWAKANPDTWVRHGEMMSKAKHLKLTNDRMEYKVVHRMLGGTITAEESLIGLEW